MYWIKSYSLDLSTLNKSFVPWQPSFGKNPQISQCGYHLTQKTLIPLCRLIAPGWGNLHLKGMLNSDRKISSHEAQIYIIYIFGCIKKRKVWFFPCDLAKGNNFCKMWIWLHHHLPKWENNNCKSTPNWLCLCVCL